MRLPSFMFVCAALAAACSLPSLPGFGGGSTTQVQRSETSSASESHEINGHPVRDDDDDRRSRKRGRDRDDDDGDRRGGGRSGGKSPLGAKARDVADFGRTCHKNHECSTEACFTGSGNLGYCTKMCNSWTECPTHWECKRAGNAPQKICMQD